MSDILKRFKLYWYLKKKLKLKSPDKVLFEKSNYNRISFIQRGLRKFNPDNCKYLEIGVFQDAVFDTIYLPKKNKFGVDPVSGGNQRMTSDEFFLKNKYLFDVIFIDGLHRYKQCQTDCINSLKFLKPNGIIFLHDLLPQNSDEEYVPQRTKTWTGDVWKVAVELTQSKNLEFRIANVDHGVGILKKRKNYSYKISDDLEDKRFDFFYENCFESLPIVSCEQAMEFIGD
mgnify:CR=1 FL=1